VTLAVLDRCRPVITNGPLKHVRVVPPLGQLPPVPFPREALPAAAELRLVERVEPQLLLQVQVVGEQRPEGAQVAARELARAKGQLLARRCALCWSPLLGIVAVPFGIPVPISMMVVVVVVVMMVPR
jgi:hypothetical protein